MTAQRNLKQTELILLTQKSYIKYLKDITVIGDCLTQFFKPKNRTVSNLIFVFSSISDFDILSVILFQTKIIKLFVSFSTPNITKPYLKTVSCQQIKNLTTGFQANNSMFSS